MAGSNYPIPLKKIELVANVVQSLCSYEMTQHYVNIETIPLETVFLFPKVENTAISKITCEFKLSDGTVRTLETKIDERQKAEEKYEDAVSKGQTAVLGTLSAPSSRSMTRVQIGNFPSKAEAVLKVYFYQNLSVDDYSFRLTVPTTYIPKYLGNVSAYLNGDSNF